VIMVLTRAETVPSAAARFAEPIASTSVFPYLVRLPLQLLTLSGPASGKAMEESNRIKDY